MKFRCIRTGSILEPANPMVEEQFKKSLDYVLLEDEETRAEDEAKPVLENNLGERKDIFKMQKDELLEYATELGIEVPDNLKKQEIIQLINAALE